MAFLVIFEKFIQQVTFEVGHCSTSLADGVNFRHYSDSLHTTANWGRNEFADGCNFVRLNMDFKELCQRMPNE